MLAAFVTRDLDEARRVFRGLVVAAPCRSLLPALLALFLLAASSFVLDALFDTACEVGRVVPLATGAALVDDRPRRRVD